MNIGRDGVIVWTGIAIKPPSTIGVSFDPVFLFVILNVSDKNSIVV